MSTASAKAQDPRVGIRLFLFFDGLVRLCIWYSSLAMTVSLFTAIDRWPKVPLIGADWHAAWIWATRLADAVIVYNLIYLAHLLVLRLLIPTPREGRYEFARRGMFQMDILWAAMATIITRARYHAPFPGFLVFHLANLPPLCWLVNAIIGPKSKSVFPLDPPFPDPKHTEIGRNVTIGYSTSLTAHVQDREGVSLKKIVVEDDVMIGAEALIYGGTTIKRGAIVYGGAVVRPDTVIGENEAWGGVPARKIKDMPPIGGAAGGRDEDRAT